MVRKILLLVALGMMVMSLIECKKDDAPEPSVQEVQLAKLSGTWNCVDATKDGVARDTFGTFKFMITGTPGANSVGFTCSGRPALSPWPANGTLTFGTDPTMDLMRSDNLDMSYVVTDNALEITFLYVGDGFPGRVRDIPGGWIFKFSK